jgi:hypothetical protein
MKHLRFSDAGKLFSPRRACYEVLAVSGRFVNKKALMN